jgi:hypothetical protein
MITHYFTSGVDEKSRNRLPSVSVGIVKLRPERAEADDESVVGAWAWIGRELATQNTRRH